MFTVLCTLYWIRFSSSSVSLWFCSILVWCLLNFSFNFEPMLYESIIFGKCSCYSAKPALFCKFFSRLWQVFLKNKFYLHTSKITAKKTLHIKQNCNCWWFRILLDILIILKQEIWNHKFPPQRSNH